MRSIKDGCSPQGQCGCCTVLVDGQPRVACVTPARRVGGCDVTTPDGLADAPAWAEAFYATGASQCGFCTPGIIMRLAALEDRSEPKVAQALLAHLCRCTGWRTIFEAVEHHDAELEAITNGNRSLLPQVRRDPDRAAARAVIEGGAPQRVGPEVALGGGAFADDTAPAGALVGVPDGRGGWAVGETLSEARAAAGKVQGRRSTAALTYPLEVPPGDWDLTLSTTWVEPAYLELDASWCVPGGEPATPLANGGAFGGKRASDAPAAARRLADAHGRPVRVLYAREDVVRLGPKRPPIAAGVRSDGTGVVRIVRTPGIADVIASMAPGIEVEEVDVVGPPTSTDPRGAGWAEAAVLLAAIRRGAGASASAGAGEAVEIEAPSGGRARVRLTDRGAIAVEVACGDPLDEVVLRSYCVGAAHMALGWVTSEGIAVDADGVPHDLTIRSFGILRARDMPPVEVAIRPDDGAPVNGSDAVFAAVAAAVWIDRGCPPHWPTANTHRT